MKSFKSLIAILAVTTVALHAVVLDDVEINELSRLHDYELYVNYATLILELKNTGLKPATIELLLDTATGSNSSAQKHIELPPGSTVVTQLEIPPNISINRHYKSHWSYHGQRSLRLDGTVNGRRVDLLSHLAYISSYPRFHLFSRSLTPSAYEKLLPYSNNYNTKTVIREALCPLQSWPTKHGDYEGITAIWISSKDNLPTQVENAIHDYVRLGGTLVIVIPPDMPRPNDIPKHGKTQKLMSGQIITFQPYDKQLEPLVMEYGKKVEEMPEGKFNREKDHPDLPNELKHDAGIKRLIGLLTMPSKDPYTIQRPIPESPVPLMQLLIVMAIFAILVGPLPYFVLHRKQKTELILLVSPAISIVFCLFTIVFITFKDGWDSRANVTAFTQLDQTTEIAATFGEISLLTPLKPKQDFLFSNDEYILFENARTVRRLDAQEQRISRNAPKPRIPLNYYYKYARKFAGKIQVDESQEQPEVVNAIGDKIEKIFLMTKPGEIYTNQNPIDPGEKTSLVKGSEIPYELKPYLGKLMPGQYVAMTKAPTFVTVGIKPDQLDAISIIHGTYR